MIESYKDTNQITSPDKFEEDVLVEQTLRPSCFDDFIGQQETVENLKVYIEAASQRDEALDHVLLFGPPGLGKNDFGWHHRQGNERKHKGFFGTGDGPTWRPGRNFNQFLKTGCIFYR